jgi:hypothetical protein
MGAASVMESGMGLLDDFGAIEKLDMTWYHQTSGPKKAGSGLVVSHKNDMFSVQNCSVSNCHPEYGFIFFR